MVAVRILGVFVVDPLVALNHSHPRPSMPLSFILAFIQFSDEAVALWVASTIVADILTVPGIGLVEARLLTVIDGHGAVENTFQLLGKFLSFYQPNLIFVDRTSNSFNSWLALKGIDDAHRDDIGHAVIVLLSTMMPTLEEA
jgi:hypothetical protein